MLVVNLSNNSGVCRGGIRTMMITGDYHHTAIAVARAVGMVQPQGQVVVIDTISQADLHSELSALRSPDVDVSRLATPNPLPQQEPFAPGVSSTRKIWDDLDHLADQQVDPDHLADQQVDPDHLADQQVDPDHLADQQIDPDHLAGQQDDPGRPHDLGLGQAQPHGQEELMACAGAGPRRPHFLPPLHLSTAQTQDVAQPRAKHHSLSLLSVPDETEEQQQPVLVPFSSSARTQSKLVPQLRTARSVELTQDQQDSMLRPQSAAAEFKPEPVSQARISFECAAREPEEAAERRISSRQSGIARVKSRLLSLLQTFVEDMDSQSEHQAPQRVGSDAGGLARMVPRGQAPPPLGTIVSSEPDTPCSPRARLAIPLSIFIPPAAPEPSWEGLRFLTVGHETMEASQALTALAEGRMQCAVTGDAFEHLLQHHDLSVLETVMRNAVIFSRMQPAQKGQVVDLLSIRGIHQLFNGQLRFIPVRFYTGAQPF